MCLEAGAENPQGAENSAVKNTAPFSLTPLKISENASILSSGLSAKLAGLRAKESAPASRSSKSKRRSGMVVPAESSENCSPDAESMPIGRSSNEPKNDRYECGPKRSRQESESSVVGKGRFHRDRRFHAAVRRSGRRVPWGYAAAARVGPRLRRRHDSTSARPSGRRCNGSRYRQEPR